MRIAGLQLEIAWEDPAENFRRATELAERATGDGARLLVLPEAFATGLSPRFEAMAGHETAIRAFVGDLARRLGVWVLAGLIEAGTGRPANAWVLVDPRGDEVQRGRKIHPFSLIGEGDRIEAGDTVLTVTVDTLRVTPLICYDLRFVELFRTTATDTDCFAVIANWPARRGHAWRTLLAARAMDCQAYVLGVNRVGVGDDQPHSGDTTLVDPLGEVIDSLAIEPGVVSGEVDPTVVTDTRVRYPFLIDRRPDVYRRL